MEVTMPTQSVQELETRLEANLTRIEFIDIEIGKLEVSSHEAASLRQLRGAYTDLALVQESGMRRAAHCEVEPLFRQELHEAAMERAIAESGMGAIEGGSMTERRDRLEAAEKRFWRAFNADCEHRSKCPSCLADRSGDK